MDAIVVKQEIQNPPYSVKQEIENPPSSHLPKPQPITYSISSDSSDSDFTDSEDDATTTGKRTRFSGDDDDSNKKQKVALPLGFLDPLPQEPILQLPSPRPLSSSPSSSSIVVRRGGSKQFWKAGDYEDDSAAVNNVGGSSNYSSVGMDHVRVHPKFLHSNATSHKWALGAIAELLDNALDEVCYGATFVNIDVLENNKDVGKMLLVEDDGGGMDPDRMRQCMSLGYSAKSKLANVIGQYGNGFKTSTMRLGADVIVFSRCCRDDKAPTQSIGLLSYTFLKSTGKEDIVVPMLDFEKGAKGWNKLVRSSPDDWNRNADTIVQWSPYTSEAELFDQFNWLGDHGTRIIIYNLWEDDQGELELDFLAEPHDIQIRGANRDEDNIKKAEQFPNSRHFLTYGHSLRSYAAILYLRLPPGFRMILRGKDIEHHNIVDDMMLTQQHTYRPTQSAAGGAPKDPNMFAQVTVGFVKDAQHHIAVQGFNVYHKNRLIKPFCRVWNAAGSGGRGVIGVLEANFVEPAHDKQGFERTTVLQRLEQRLHHMQKSYWNSQSHAIGYVNRHSVKNSNASATRQSSPDYSPHQSRQPNKSTPAPEKPIQQNTPQLSRSSTRNCDNDEANQDHAADENVEHVQTRSHVEVVNGSGKVDAHTSDTNSLYLNHLKDTFARDLELERKKSEKLEAQLEVKAAGNSSSDSDRSNLIQLRLENEELKERLTKLEESFLLDLQSERDRCSSLEAQLKESKQKMEQMNKEQDDLIDIFSEERNRRNNEEANLRKRLTDASSTIDNLLDRVRYLEKMKSVKQEH